MYFVGDWNSAGGNGILAVKTDILFLSSKLVVDQRICGSSSLVFVILRFYALVNLFFHNYTHPDLKPA